MIRHFGRAGQFRGRSGDTGFVGPENSVQAGVLSQLPRTVGADGHGASKAFARRYPESSLELNPLVDLGNGTESRRCVAGGLKGVACRQSEAFVHVGDKPDRRGGTVLAEDLFKCDRQLVRGFGRDADLGPPIAFPDRRLLLEGENQALIDREIGTDRHNINGGPGRLILFALIFRRQAQQAGFMN